MRIGSIRLGNLTDCVLSAGCHRPNSRFLMSSIHQVLTLLFFMLFAHFQANAVADDTYTNHIRETLSTHCFKCHGPDKQKGKLRLDTLDPDMVNGKDAPHWHDVLDQINRGEMPPEDEEEVPDAPRQALVAWLTEGLEKAVAAKKGPLGGLRRLNNAQYANTLKDLFEVSVDYSAEPPKDSAAKNGFKTNANALFMSSAHMEQYMKIADAILERTLPSVPPEIHQFKMLFGRNSGRDVKNKLGQFYRNQIPSRHYEITHRDAPPPFKSHQLDQGYSFMMPNKKLGTMKKVTYSANDHSYYAFRRSGPDVKNTDGAYVREDGLAMPPVFNNKLNGTNPRDHTLSIVMRDFPSKGRFVIRVEAYKAALSAALKYNGAPELKQSEVADKAAIVIAPASFTLDANTKLENGVLSTVNLKDKNSVECVFNSRDDGLYVLYSYFGFKEVSGRTDAPSITINGDEIRRCFSNKKLKSMSELLVKLKKGENTLKVKGAFGGMFIEGLAFKKVESSNAELQAMYDDRFRIVPTMRAFAGTQERNGHRVRFLDAVHEVHATKSNPKIYEFYGDLEEFPVPVKAKSGKSITSSLMTLGMENNQFISKDGPSIVVKSIEFIGPYLEQWPTKAHQSIFVESRNKANERLYAKEILTRFLFKAYRRTPRSEEFDLVYQYWQDNRKRVSTFKESIKNTLSFIITSPQFLYFVDPANDPEETELSDFELASRLSYFLWNTMPDGQLLAHAVNGTLKQEIPAETDRLLKSERSWDFSKAFSSQWLDLEKIDIVVTAFPLKEYFVEELKNETYHFFHEILKSNLSVSNFVDSDFVSINQNLAQYYGFENVSGAQFRKVSLPADSKRGGLLTQASIMWANSTGIKSHPIKRGVWLASKILGTPPPDPPPGIPEIDETDPKFKRLSLIEQLKAHREYASCVDCHKKIDPWGLPFESFGADGLLKADPIAHTAKLPDGTNIQGMDALKHYLLNDRRKDVARSVVANLLSYSIGRELTFQDEASIKTVISKTKSAGYKMQDIIKEIVLCDSFNKK